MTSRPAWTVIDGKVIKKDFGFEMHLVLWMTNRRGLSFIKCMRKGNAD